MGGTSTDVSRYDGSYEHVFESTTAGVCIQAPQVCINMCIFLCSVQTMCAFIFVLYNAVYVPQPNNELL